MALSLSVVLIALLINQAAPGDLAPGDLAPGPAPQTSPAVKASPGAGDSAASSLREIGHVKAVTEFCKAVFAHATVAVQSALTDDAALEETETWLGSVELDHTNLDKFKGITDLNNRYVLLRKRAVSGIGEIKALREAAKAAPTDDQRKELTVFANALGGALERQVKLADAMERFAGYLDAHQPVTQQEKDAAYLAASSAPYNVVANEFVHTRNPNDLVPPSLTDEAKVASVELTTRQNDVFGDEARAAEHIQPAFSGCS